MKFAADAPLGKLSKWLRIIGYDCIYPASPEERRPDDDRIFLTRTAGARGKGVIFIGCDRIDDQIETLIRLLPLREGARPFSRCTICNIPLEPVEKETISGDVPDHIYTTHDDFRICPGCKRVFWPGTHRERMEDRIEALFGKKRSAGR